MRLIFMGTPDFAVPALIELAARGHDIAAVYTRAPKPAGRGMDVQVTPVAREALRLSIPVLTPVTLKTGEAQAVFAAHRAEAAVVVAYGLILPKPVLDAVPLGCFNIHASILPRWRGAAPINRAIMAGDAESGVSIMRMNEGLDTGDVAMIERVRISEDMTAGELHDALAPLGADAMLRSLAALERGSLQFTPQPATGATYAEKIQKSETRIDWSQPAQAVHNHIRGLSPKPVAAWCEFPGGARVKVLRSSLSMDHDLRAIVAPPGTVLDVAFSSRLTVACGSGAIDLLEIQRSGKQSMLTSDFLRGSRTVSAMRLT